MPTGKEVAEEIKRRLKKEEELKKTETSAETKPATKPAATKAPAAEKKAQTQKPKAQEKPATVPKKKPAEVEKKKAPEEKFEEKIVVISLRKAWKTPRNKRTNAAISALRAGAERITKKPVRIDLPANNALWKKSITTPPRKIKVKLLIGKEIARVTTA